jgi:hypothetical protein
MTRPGVTARADRFEAGTLIVMSELGSSIRPWRSAAVK